MKEAQYNVGKPKVAYKDDNWSIGKNTLGNGYWVRGGQPVYTFINGNIKSLSKLPEDASGAAKQIAAKTN